MKKLLSILAFLPLLAFGIDIRPITQVNDINRVGSEYYTKQVTWFQGESLRFDVLARDVRTPLDLSGQVFPVLFVGVETNQQQVYIARTGTVVSATNGHVRVEVPYQLALLPTNTKYSAWMIAFRVTAGTTQEIATVAYSAVNVYPSPLGVVYTNITPQTSYVISAGGIVVEEDPVFTSSVAATVTAEMTGQWSTAYSWGDHAVPNYPSRWSGNPATQAVDIAGQTLSDVGLLQMRANGNSSTNPAAVYWNAAYGTLNLVMDKLNPDGSPVVNEIGYNTFVRVRNASGAVISNTWAVSVLPGSGGLVSVERARQPDKVKVIGLATHDIPNGEEGIINFFGEIGQAATFGIAEGTEVYLSTNTAGLNWTTNASAAGASPMRLGYVAREASSAGAGNGQLIVDIFDIEADPLFASWLSTNTYVKSESDPVWSAVSNSTLTRITAVETGKVALSTYITATQNLWTANGLTLTNATGSGRISAVKTGRQVAISFDATGLATGTPLYAFSETDPVYEAEKSRYATGTPVYVESDPVYNAEKSLYATGTPLYAFSEADPLWTAASSNYYTVSQADALFATGSPIYSIDGLATGTPLYAFTESDPVFGAWLAANGSAPEQGYAVRSVVATNPVIATNILVFDDMSDTVIELPTNGIAYVTIESDISANSANLFWGDGFVSIPPGTSTVYIGSAIATNLIVSYTLGLPALVPVDITNTISKISIFQYLNPLSFGQTNDQRLTTVLVKDATLQNEPVTKGTFDSVVGAIRVDQWSQSPAVTALDINGNEIRFGNNFEAIATTNAFTFSYRGLPFMRFLSGTSSDIGTGSTYLVSARVTSTTITLGVYASPGYIPRPQYGTEVTNWFDILSYVSSYPTNDYGVYTISFDTPATNQVLFFRPTLDADPEYDSTSEMQITADQLTLLGRRMVINDTNGSSVITLSATGGLSIGTAKLRASKDGNITQDSTNSAYFGQVSIAKVIGDLPLDAINAAPGYSRAILFPNTATSSTNLLSSYSSSLYFYNPSDTNRLLGWQTRIVTEGSLAAGLVDSGLKIGTNSFELDKDGNLAANWDLGGYTLSNGIIEGYLSTGAFASALAPYATTSQVATVSTSLTAAIALKLNASETNALVYTGALTSALSGYVTTSALASAVAPYVTTGALEAAIAVIDENKLDISTAADTYATTNDLGEAVSNLTAAIDLKLDATATNDFVTSETLTNSLAGYATTGSVVSALSGYATTAALSGYVATNGSAANLVSFPASLLTVNGGNSNYWRITTAPASNSSFGQRGQMAVSSSNVFIYNPDGGGTGTGRWVRIQGSISW